MKTLSKSVIIQVLALLLSTAPAFAQERSGYAQPELDQMLAPIALYPDALLSQILMASTYPLEVVQAARWSRAHPQLKGQDAVRAVEDKDWEPSVKSLVAFPEILAMMDRKLDWTERLGNAFLAQQDQVMDTVQDLRRRAEVAGNLRSDDRVRILRQDETIIIEPADPYIVYVPYYNPVIVYGPWWWPAYPPVYWAPWPGYYTGPAFVSGFYWGSGITISAGFFFSTFDWHHHHVRIVHVDYYRSHAHVSRRATIIHDRPGVWRHDPGHRRGIPYRHAAPREEPRHSPPPRIDTRRDIQERNAAPTVRQEDTRQFNSPRRSADNPGRRAEPKTGLGPRVEKREDERVRPGTDRERREFREPREPRGAQRERPGNDRSESRREGGRYQRNVEPQSSAAPAVRQARLTEAPRPQPPVQHFGERGQRHNMGSGEAFRRPSADNSHPRARGDEAGRRGGDTPRRQFTPAAGRPAPG